MEPPSPSASKFTPPQTYGHTAEYEHIHNALTARWAGFLGLEKEIHEFTPKPFEAFDSRRLEEFERISKLNPDASPQDIQKLVDAQFTAIASTSMQMYFSFSKRHMTEYVTVLMLSHALCEALINAVLAIGLAYCGRTDLFPLLERAELKHKWLIAPKSISAEYSFPKGTALHESLVFLIRQRNALVHYKVDLEVDGKKVLEGSSFRRLSYGDELTWMRRFFSLPYDLSLFIARSLRGAPIMLLLDRGSIEPFRLHVVS